ncbi:MAG TPA: hypothetical protein VGN20_17810 [Mucilaginibacter sp.]|jgi:hypothetical protein
MKSPGTLFIVIAILALIVVVVIYTRLPISEAQAKGEIWGMTIMATGPLAGYIILLLLYRHLVVSLDIFGLNSPQLDEKKKIAGNWEIESKSLLSGMVFKGALTFVFKNGKLSLSGNLLNHEGKKAIEVVSQLCELTNEDQLFLAYRMNDLANGESFEGISRLNKTNSNEMEGHWSTFGGTEVHNGSITYKRTK